ncbi:GNAT family N-acetyltransferase [Uliginosibacterium sp. H3]|uniref:GNAT family N-acetyltransferase n=1 Tax=Uliginosibacterium silvisoli TaxID=3114758 RepID=A0ABU6JYN8_9RHOO|nr:GNAT family N-acetyltransferase [Uliginosibacterium sp. H3]
MQTRLRPATPEDFAFAFEAKREALGPHIRARWAWNEDFQREIHGQRWQERPWFIIEIDGLPIGTLSVEEHADHMRFGEFYLLPAWQGRGIGSDLLRATLRRADELALPVRLEYLQWNPVGSLYLRHGFKQVSESATHFFLVREPGTAYPQD